MANPDRRRESPFFAVSVREPTFCALDLGTAVRWGRLDTADPADIRFGYLGDSAHTHAIGCKLVNSAELDTVVREDALVSVHFLGSPACRATVALRLMLPEPVIRVQRTCG